MRLLVYIPCWTNYAEGWHQIQRLRQQEFQLRGKGISLEVEFIVSVNAVETIEPVYLRRFISLGENFRHFRSNLSDVNINLGFLDASRKEADLFWIVSPSDTVSPSALERVVEFLQPDSELDFLVADEEGRGIRDFILRWKDLDFQIISEASFGLVTGVVYRLNNFRPYLHHGLQASYTGWGQLAVLLGASQSPGGVKGRILPSDYFYYRGDSKELIHDEKLENLRTYAHSFFGLVILFSLLSPKPSVEIRRWVRTNWYRIGAYHQAYTKEKYGYVRITDLRKMAKVALGETDMLTRLLYRIASHVDFSSFRKE